MRNEKQAKQQSELLSGAHFLRCALQVNPHHYAETYRGKKSSGLDESGYVKAVLEKAQELDIRVLAITDHNHVGSVKAFRDAAKPLGITVFPGFEISSQEGIHVLSLYDVDTPVASLERFLGQLGITDTSPQSSLSNHSFSSLLETVKAQGGLTIAAHVTLDDGCLKKLTGQSRIAAWRDPNLLAVQIPGNVEDLPPEYKSIVQNKNPDYRRDHAAGKALAVAVVNAKDVCKAEDLADPSASCFIKMSWPSLEAIRQAFLDPESRVRLNSDPAPEEHAEITEIAWEGGFLGGGEVRFNDNLNVLIGGRGTGKSTVIESLRYVLQLDPLGADAQKTHANMVKDVIRSGTKISLKVRTRSPDTRDYVIERTVPNPPIVREVNGAIARLTPRDILPRVEVLGQHEIAELARQPDKLTQLLNRFRKSKTDIGGAKQAALRGLEQSRGRLKEIQAQSAQIGDRLSKLPALEEMLKRFQQAGLEDRLKEQSLLVREERILKTAYERISEFQETVKGIRDMLPLDTAFASPKALEGLPSAHLFLEIEGSFANLSRDVTRLIGEIEKAIGTCKSSVDATAGRWREHQAAVQQRYEKLLRELQRASVDGEEFIRLRKQLEELRPLRDRKKALDKQLQEEIARRDELLVQWEEVLRLEFQEIQAAAQTVSKQLKNQLRVDVKISGDRTPLESFLRDHIGGRLTETVDRISGMDQLSLRQFAAACRQGGATLIVDYGIPNSQADRIANALPDILLQLEELYLPPTTDIALNVSPEAAQPEWKLLKDLSTGQKATAVLLLLLLESDAPLVVDQPEDDLDNRFVTDTIVPRMRAEKRRRQFIFATHNANIPVLGDAEQIVGLSPAGEAVGDGTIKLRPEHMGSIDSKPVRELVEEVLEGGKEAFERRRAKYGF
ncbi:MAG: phosphoesterase [Betaproteobacteria bacterium RIFCSPLOWO2_02_FULL_68_150]|nr:MAG: phosphoesterase [Betaproteobacteria bacterium RIFCSPLOWO2_02_FULL_68_150]